MEKGKKGERVSPEGADDDVATLSVASLSHSGGDTREEQTGQRSVSPRLFLKTFKFYPRSKTHFPSRATNAIL